MAVILYKRWFYKLIPPAFTLTLIFMYIKSFTSFIVSQSQPTQFHITKHTNITQEQTLPLSKADYKTVTTRNSNTLPTSDSSTLPILTYTLPVKSAPIFFIKLNKPQKNKISDQSIKPVTTAQHNKIGRAIYNFQHGYTQEQLMNSVEQEEYGKITLEYVPLNCTKPKFIREYRNPCWLKCSKQESCDPKNATALLEKTTAQLICAPRVILMGIRKCGTSDIWHWFSAHDQVVNTNADYDVSFYRGICGITHAEKHWQSVASANQHKFQHEHGFDKSNTYFLDAPGQILYHCLISRQDNHFKLNYALQLFQEFEISESRYILSLREPACRAISQIYEWHHHKNAFRGWKQKEITPEIVHNITAIQLERVKICFKKYGPKGCIFMTPAVDGPDNFDALLLWGLYVEYLEEAFKFIDRRKWIIINLPQYSSNEVEVMKEVFKFSGLPFQNKNHEERKQINKRVRPEVYPETMNALRTFYKPFNKRLADLLQDDKWLFTNEE